MANDHLRNAIAAKQLTFEAVADRLGVSPKTVERWVTVPRMPYQRHRLALSSLLGVEVARLWPSEPSSDEVTKAGQQELVALYPHRSAVPAKLWTDLFSVARERLDVLVYSGFWLSEDPDFRRIVVEKATGGISVRFLMGAPDSAAVSQRGKDEGIGVAMASKIRNALVNYTPLFGIDRVEFRLHDTVLYNSIYISDDQMLVNGHIHGVGAYMAPVLHLRRLGGELFDSYAQSFEGIWSSAMKLKRPQEA